MRKIIHKTFGLRDGEIHISFLMQLFVFIIITVLLIVKPTVNALFVSQLGADNLPFGYLLVAITAILSSYFYNTAIRKFSLVKLTTATLIVFSVCFVLLSFSISSGFLHKWILYFYYITVSLFAVVTTSQFWILANMIFNAREAKRIFGFIGAGAIAGGIFGGYLTSFISALFGNEYSVFVAAILLLSCIPILRKIWKLRIRKLSKYIRKQKIVQKQDVKSSSFKLIYKSKHLTFIALITGVSVIVAKLVDFQFSDFAHKLIPDSNNLASFFGFWFSTFNVVALTIQLFLTNKILAKLGVSTTLLILPLAIGFGCLLFLTFPELWVLIILKGIDGSLKQSTNKAALELSIMPIPIDIKNQSKSFIDVVVDSVATGLAGFILIFLIKKLDLDTSYITVIILFFAFVWILLIYKLREAYFNSFKRNLQKKLHTELDLNKQRKVTTITRLKNILESDDEEAIITVLRRLKTYKISNLKNAIKKLLDHSSHRVKEQAIKNCYTYNDVTVLNKIKDIVQIQDDKLVLTALDYILHHPKTNESKFFNTFLDHQNIYIANAALLTLSKESYNNYKLAKKYDLNNRLEDKIRGFKKQGVSIKKEVLAGLLVSIAYSGLTKQYGFILTNLNHTDKYVVKYAIIAAGITADKQFLDYLFNLVGIKKLRKTVIKALKNYDSEIIDVIQKIEKNDDFNEKTKRYLPRIIRAFKGKKSIDLIYSLLKSKDVFVRLESSKSLLKIKQKNASLNFDKRSLKSSILRETEYYQSTLDIISSLESIIPSKGKEVKVEMENLLILLEEELQVSLECLFNLMRLIYNESDIDMSLTAINSLEKETRMNALEFLDNLLKSQLKQKIFPILENYVVERNHYPPRVLTLTEISEKACMISLLKNRGNHIKKVTLMVIEKTKNTSYLTTLDLFKNQYNDEIRSIIRRVIFNLNKS